MTDSSAIADADVQPLYGDDEISLLAIANMLLRWRRPIIALAILGGIIGLISGLRTPATYTASATFVPLGADNSAPTGLAAAASQFGLKLGSGGGSWGVPMYIALIATRGMLLPIVFDTVVVSEEGRRRASMIDLFIPKGVSPPERIEQMMNTLPGVIAATEDRKLNAVRISATTKWPSVSLALANRMLERVNEFNIETRRSQAISERKFIDAQSAEAERALRAAEDRMQSFLQTNRAVEGSPQLVFERDRLQREVMLRQQLYTSWMQNREDARVREVRDTPAISVLEEPRLPLQREGRGTVRKIMFMAFFGAAIGLVFAILSQAMRAARQATSPEAEEFVSHLRSATPKFIRKRVW
jgi:uncharacterized protein involved in exopolysaccharide biosynthesis